MAKELMSRDQVKVEDTWNVNDVYETEELWEADVKLVNDKLEELTKFAGKVCESANTLLKVLEETAFVEEKVEKAYFYSARLFDEDQGNSKHRSMNQKMVSLYAKMESDLSFITPEILACDSAKLEQFYNEEAGLELYKKDVPIKAAAAKADEIFAKARRSMPHGLGHGIGLQIHESPFVRQRAEPEAVFKPGMIVTLEPGLYDPDLGGVRLENDVLITEDGNEVLTFCPCRASGRRK